MPNHGGPSRYRHSKLVSIRACMQSCEKRSLPSNPLNRRWTLKQAICPSFSLLSRSSSEVSPHGYGAVIARIAWQTCTTEVEVQHTQQKARSCGPFSVMWVVSATTPLSSSFNQVSGVRLHMIILALNRRALLYRSSYPCT
jgi:hypothetical protein